METGTGPKDARAGYKIPTEAVRDDRPCAGLEWSWVQSRHLA